MSTFASYASSLIAPYYTGPYQPWGAPSGLGSLPSIQTPGLDTFKVANFAIQADNTGNRDTVFSQSEVNSLLGAYQNYKTSLDSFLQANPILTQYLSGLSGQVDEQINIGTQLRDNFAKFSAASDTNDATLATVNGITKVAQRDWNVQNISAFDLAAQGQQTPGFFPFPVWYGFYGGGPFLGQPAQTFPSAIGSTPAPAPGGSTTL